LFPDHFLQSRPDFQQKRNRDEKIFNAIAIAFENFQTWCLQMKTRSQKKYPSRTQFTPVPASVPVENFWCFKCDRNREILFLNAITIAQKNFQTW
jgi:hypothetical protein